MKKFYIYIPLCLALVACGPKVPQLGKSPVKDVVNAMTLEEKVHLVIGTGMPGFTGDSTVVNETHTLVPGVAGTTYPIHRLGIPPIVLADGPAGLRISSHRDGDSATYYCTHFPIGMLLASSWDDNLVEQVGQAIGNEVLEYGVDVLLAPAMNLQRNPLCGRNFEYYSEDPFLTGNIAASYVKGVQKNGVGTSIKHFAANNQESNRTENDSRVSQRALRELYLKSFEIAVKKANPWTVMTSYNYLNGVYTSEDKELITDLLRDEWKFKGLVVSDWYGGKDALKQMEAGNDMLQPGSRKQYNAILEGIKNGKLQTKVLDENVERILELIVKTPRFKGYKYSNKPDLVSHAQLSRQSAAEGMVLLKNESALPLGKNILKIALFGCTSYDFIAGGTGAGNVNRAYTVSLLDGLKSAGYSIDDNLKRKYQDYIEEEKKKKVTLKDKMAVFLPEVRLQEMAIDNRLLDEEAAKMDVALITIGRTSGEYLDRTPNDFCLTDKEKLMIRNVSKAFHLRNKKVIVVLNVGGVVETDSWKADADAILLAWQGGQEGGNSVTDILRGIVSPSGKLPVTFPVNWNDIASSANFPYQGRAANTDLEKRSKRSGNERLWDYTEYKEGIFVGYRDFDFHSKKVSYPFGYGLSYTRFNYGNALLEDDDEKIKVSLEVTNVGDYKGKEIVEVYVSAPKDGNIQKPEKELKGYVKTKLLNPGDKENVSISVDKSSLASFDEANSTWRVDSGDYRILIGASSRDIKQILNLHIDKPIEHKVHNILKMK